MRLKRELGFVALVSIVIGSQIGASAFMNPALLAKYNLTGIIGLAIAAMGAISLSLVFSNLSSHLPKNGGPHVYVVEAFGRAAGFFTAWIYWIISWLSNAVLLSIIVGYLVIVTGELTSTEVIMLETFIVLVITCVNIIGVKFSGAAGIILTALKMIPFFILPLVFSAFFEASNFKISLSNLSFDFDAISTTSKVVLLGFFGFIGVECATAPAESVRDPKKTIPRALIMGTLIVAAVYIINVVSMVGLIGFERLAESSAPYAVAIEKIFGHSSKIAMSFMAIVVCVGTLNAWTLISGQIAYGAYEEGLFPSVFGKLNKSGAPVVALLLAAVGMIICFIVQQSDSLKDSLIKLVNISVSIFLYVYFVCCLAYMKLIPRWKKTTKERMKAYILSIFSIAFCVFVLAGDMLWETGTSSLLALAAFIILGVPIFLNNKKSIRQMKN